MSLDLVNHHCHYHHYHYHHHHNPFILSITIITTKEDLIKRNGFCNWGELTASL